MTDSSPQPAPPTDFDWGVRARIYQTFAETGRAPAIPGIAAAVGATEHQIEASLTRLYAAHEIATFPDRPGVWMANPFSAVPTAFVVQTPEMTCWANCAWDALGVPAILDTDGWTTTRCATSGDTLRFGVENGVLKGDSGVIHLVTPIRDAWADIGFT